MSLVCVAMAAAPGCGPPRSAAVAPEIHYGEEECSTCRMIVSEERHASVLSTVSGEVARFDDLRCLLGYLETHAADVSRVWVHGSGSGWIPAREAWFAESDRTITPMGSGLTAFSTRQEAESFGNVVGWDELRADRFAGAPRSSEIQRQEESL